MELHQGECDNVLFGDEMEYCLRRIRDGDESAREKLIQEARPFITRVVGRLCGRSLSWDLDDELSIGLIAFNEAIDRFKFRLGVPFSAFARMVIRSRVTDHLRKESRWNQVDLRISDQTIEGSVSRAEREASWDQYIAEVANLERKEEILMYSNKIKDLGITFSDLVQSSPKHRDTREKLIKAACYLAENRSLYLQMQDNKRMPIRELISGTGISRKVLERGRKYIIAVATLLFYQEEFLYLNSYISMPRGEG